MLNMNRIIKILTASAICLMLSVVLYAQKHMMIKKSGGGQTVYPNRDNVFKPGFKLSPVGTFDKANVEGLLFFPVQAPDFTGHVLKRNMTRKQVSLQQVSCRENNITDEKEWVINNNLTLRELPVETPIGQFGPRYSYYTGGYLVTIYGPHYGETLKLVITDLAETQLYAAYDFESFRYSPKTTLMGNTQCMQDVIIEGNVMYVSHGSRSYSDGAGYQTGYITAYDLEKNEIIWTTQPMTCNSSFTIYGNSIICGYGFTAEPDNLYVLDKYSGQRVHKYPVKKMVERVVVKDGKAYVRTYSYDYVFSVK